MTQSQLQLNSWAVPVTLSVSGAIGFLVGHRLKKRALAPSDILAQVKHLFREEGPVSGSWIENQPVDFQRFAYKTTAYRGGISRLEDRQSVTYEFLADAKTGTILKIKRIETAQ